MEAPLFERESGEAITYRTGGVGYALAPPSSLSLDDILEALSGPESFVKITMPVRPDRLPSAILDNLLDTWVERYGLVGGRSLTRLLFLVRQYAVEIEWDLRREAGIDAGDLWRTRQWRRLLSSIDNLPRASRYHQAMSDDPEHVEQLMAAYDRAGQADQPDEAPKGPPMAVWTHELEILTKIYDAVRDGSWITAAANSEKAPERPKPSPFPTSLLQRTLAGSSIRQKRQKHSALARMMVPHRFKDEETDD